MPRKKGENTYSLVGRFNKAGEQLQAKLKESEERCERLEEALHSIALNTCCDTCQEAALVANQALSTDANKGEG